MEQEDRTFYIAIIIACIVGIAIITNTIMSSPKYEEHYTELYFYGEKITFDGTDATFRGHDVQFVDGMLHIVSGDGTLGPLGIGDTVLLDGVHWNVEDASEASGEVLMRAVPSQAAPGEEITFLIVIENHRGADLTYGCTVGTAAGPEGCAFAVADGQQVQESITVTVPAPPEGQDPQGTYDEVFQTYVRHVVDYGEFKLVTVEDEAGLRDPYWRTRVSVTLQTGNTIYFWLRLDDE